MEYRNLGHSGLKVSVAGIGCLNFGWRSDEAETKAIVAGALDLGVNFFDTADRYGSGGLSEEFLGKALAGRRHEAVIATKFGAPMGVSPLLYGGSRRYVLQAVEASLRRLQTDYIDLYQMHLPDPATPIEGTMHALDALVRQGKVRYIGCSNFAAWQIAEAQWAARQERTERFVSAQNMYNLIDRRLESDVIPVCKKYGLGVLPYLPLAGGFLTGKYKPGQPLPEDSRMGELARTALSKGMTYLSGVAQVSAAIPSQRNFDILAKLEAFAAERGHTVAELAIAWLAAHPLVPSVISGVSHPAQIEANVKAVEWKLSPDDLKEIDGITHFKS